MITKERLEALIGEGAKIYAIVKNPFIAGYSQILEVEEFDLNAPIHKEISEDGKQFLYFNYLLDSEYLFETEEDAHWSLEMTATRTETLKLPKWEEFIQNDKQVIFYDKDINIGVFVLIYSIIGIVKLVEYIKTNKLGEK